ncbi:MAG: hypothetical protein ACYTEL_16290 [Planctomycetota bacterium]|jgi:prepilin-type processing-associated H-X9-DG protein
MSKKESKTPNKQPVELTLAVMCLIIFLVTGIVLPIFQRGPHEPFLHFVVMLGLPCLVLSLTLAVIALRKILQTKEPTALKIIATATISSSVLLMVFWFRYWSTRPYYQPYYAVICGTNISGLAKSIVVYANDANELPEAEKWCDLLVGYDYASPKQFICGGSDARIGESSYAMNQNLSGKMLSGIPPDTVLLFETSLGKEPAGRQEVIQNREWYKILSQQDDRLKKKYRRSKKVYKLRWNQSGGPEILTTENHEGTGCNVAFVDAHVVFVKTDDLAKLKWKPEEDTK